MLKHAAVPNKRFVNLPKADEAAMKASLKTGELIISYQCMTVDAGISDMPMKLRFWHVVSRSIRYALSVASRYRRTEDDGLGSRPRSVRLNVAGRRDREPISRERRRRKNSWNQ